MIYLTFCRKCGRDIEADVEHPSEIACYEDKLLCNKCKAKENAIVLHNSAAQDSSRIITGKGVKNTSYVYSGKRLSEVEALRQLKKYCIA